MSLKKPFSRRRLLSAGALGTLAMSCAFYSHWTRRVVGGLIDDASRTIDTADRTPCPSQWDSNRITAAWLGHSSVLVNFLGVTILTDPVLFARIGADMRFGTVGPKRLIASALHP